MTVLLAALALLVPTTALRDPSEAEYARIDGPATVYAPATRMDPPGPVCAVDDVPCIIRDVWPDDLEERALRIAWRESNWQPDIRNACCYGLFQIYYWVHRAWLADYGVTKASDLYDPRVNATVAYALYQKAGWAPWQT